MSNRRPWQHSSLIQSSRVLDELLRRIEINSDGCWIWVSTFNQGHNGAKVPRITINDSMYLARKLLYECLVRELVPGETAHNVCGIEECINIGHTRIKKYNVAQSSSND